jgi:hypothetical protein
MGSSARFWTQIAETGQTTLILNMDLFTPVVSESEMHHNFKIMLGPDSLADRDVLKRWAVGFVDRDGKFAKEFQTTFNGSFWELYIFACCKELGFNVNFGFGAPDFVIDNFHNEFCIEARIASNAKGEKAEWETDLKIHQPTEQILETAVIRLSNALQSKHQKYLDSYRTLPHVKGRPFVVALSPFEQPYFYAQNDHAIRQVLFGYDRVGPGGEHQLRKVAFKASGAPVELGLFTSNKMPEISAVIFSNTATLSKVHALNGDLTQMMWFSALTFNQQGPEPVLANYEKANYCESLLDGLYVFHNRHALHPLPFSYFNHDDITQGALVGDSPVPKYNCKHGALIQRTSFRVRAME